MKTDLHKTAKNVVKTGAFTASIADEKILDENGKIDLNKFSPITYDPVHHTYRKLGDVVGKGCVSKSNCTNKNTGIKKRDDIKIITLFGGDAEI